MTHRERLQAAALVKWLEVYSKQLRCEQCIAPKDARCHKHQPEIAKLLKDTKMILAGGPN